MTGTINKIPSKHDNWSHLHLKTIPFSFTWTIDKFSLRSKYESNKPIESSSFAIGDDKEQSEWHVILRPKGITEMNTTYLSLYLNFWSINDHETVKIHVAIIDNKMERTNVKYLKYTVKRGNFWGWPKFIEMEKLISNSDKLLPEDTLTLSIEGFVVGNERLYFSGIRSWNFEVPKCDITLWFDNEKVEAHKSVLAAQSRVFSKYFKCRSGLTDFTLPITDVQPKVVHEMLRFIYTGQAPNVEKIAVDLLAIADVFQLEELKVLCGEALLKTVTDRNALDILIIADRHGEKVLKEETIRYINAHPEQIIYDQRYKNYPRLLDEILRHSAAEQTCCITVGENCPMPSRLNIKRKKRIRSNSC